MPNQFQNFLLNCRLICQQVTSDNNDNINTDCNNNSDNINNVLIIIVFLLMIDVV